MADYTPIFFPGEVIPLTASGGVAGGDLVVVSGSGTIAKAGALAATTYVGVAAQDAGANTRVSGFSRGIVHASIADGTVTAGDQVTTTNTANRQVKTAPAVTTPTPADVTTSRAVIGVALITAADGQKVRWMQI